MEQLKPCPFCGSTDIKIMKMGYPHWIVCMNCGAKVQGGTHNEKDSITAWNRRTGPRLEKTITFEIDLKLNAEQMEYIMDEVEKKIGG